MFTVFVNHNKLYYVAQNRFSNTVIYHCFQIQNNNITPSIRTDIHNVTFFLFFFLYRIQYTTTDLFSKSP